MNAWMQLLGGLGLFLFGMTVMSSGLRKLAGDSLRKWLARSTRNVVSGAFTGAIVTALVQSSSATTVAAVGFVGAGLLTFQQSLGIIFGANIGTTATGWMVALLGFKLDLKEVALPLLFVAAICYLFKQLRKLRGFGKALAGFCLIFLGIGYLQSGLSEYRDVIDLSQWSAADLGGRLTLLLIGVLLTLITQSSSATVATAITALNAAVLTLPQAAAVIIGADIGTTATAGLATIGGTTASRRTGFAHVIYNLMTGVMAFVLLPFYLQIVARYWPALDDSPEVVAVGFHSAFNIIGVLLILPLAHPFGRMIERLIPQQTSRLVAIFDKRLLEDPLSAVAALENGTKRIASLAARLVADNLAQEKGPSDAPGLEEIKTATRLARDYATHIGKFDDDIESDAGRVFACLHILDHVERLVERIEQQPKMEPDVGQYPLAVSRQRAEALIRRFSNALNAGEIVEVTQQLRMAASELDDDRSEFRRHVIRAAAAGELPGSQLDDALDFHRWLRRVVYHAWRIANYCDKSSIDEAELRPLP